MLSESALMSLEALINRQIDASTPARERLARLEGRSFSVNVDGGNRPLIVLHFAAHREGLRLSLGAEEADARVRGALGSLIRLVAGRAEGGNYQSGVTVEGDATVVQGFEQLFRHARPDIDAEMARLLGDMPAHYAMKAARHAFAAGRRALDTLTRSGGEYLVEESRDVVGRDELASFHHDVDRLRDDVERLEARFNRLITAQEGKL